MSGFAPAWRADVEARVSVCSEGVEALELAVNARVPRAIVASHTTAAAPRL